MKITIYILVFISMLYLACWGPCLVINRPVFLHYAMSAGISHDISIGMCHVGCKGIPRGHVVCFSAEYYACGPCDMFFQNYKKNFNLGYLKVRNYSNHGIKENQNCVVHGIYSMHPLVLFGTAGHPTRGIWFHTPHNHMVLLCSIIHIWWQKSHILGWLTPAVSTVLAITQIDWDHQVGV